MIKAGVAGLGWWGKTLVEAVADGSDEIEFVAATTRSLSSDAQAFCKDQGLELLPSYEAMLEDPAIDAVVLATPHSLHVPQVVAAAAAGKHVFCEKPFALDKAGAEEAVAAMEKAGLTLGLGYNRRFHPTIADLRERIRSGAMGTILHFEGTMCFPNALYLKPDAWRASREETPCGGLTPMGVHVVDGVIDLFGEVESVFCMSHHRVVEVDNDDTTAILFKMKEGMSGYLGTMTATGGCFRLQVYGSKGWLRIDGMTHIAGAPSEERRTRLFGECTFHPVKGEPEVWQADAIDLSRVCLEAFAKAANGGPAYLIPTSEMIHGAAVTETIVKSANSGVMETVV